MSSNCYYPILKTTVSEMRALKQFDCSDSTIIHPILELTKARKSKYDDIGDVYKRVQEIADIVKKNDFYLDLTSEESLSNPQIETYFDDFNYFENWRLFIESLIEKGLNVKPIIQAFDDSSVHDLQNQMQFFSDICGAFAIRLKPEYLEMDIAQNLLQAAQPFKFTTILDAEYVDKDTIVYSTSIYSSFLKLCEANSLKLGDIIVCSSSFPSMVNHKNMDHGDFEVFEKDFFTGLSRLFPQLHLKYGDYASVHPFRNEVTAYNWVPRIDYPTNNKVIFCRKQRNLGGYQDCASRMVATLAFKTDSLTCWGTQEVIDACHKPNGKSPSYWISVRINIHMERSILWLRQ